MIEHGFPNVRVARIDEDYYTVTRINDQVQLEPWEARSHATIRQWLASYGCEDAEWRDASEFM